MKSAKAIIMKRRSWSWNLAGILGLALCPMLVGVVLAQTLQKEYIYLNGKLIAVENAATPDITEPTITDVHPSFIGTTTATIEWTTNEVADSQVEYGVTTSYGSSTTLNSSLVTPHTQALSGLTGHTLYHYRVKSKDKAGNLATSADYTFTTSDTPDTTPPTISDIASSNITSSGAKIMWTTHEAADTQVEYGTTTSYGSSTTLDSEWVTWHFQDLTGLTGNTLYHFRVKSKDEAGNLATSEDYTFTTSPPPDTTPPIISYVASSNVTGSGATITWTTNEASNTQVEYGVTTSYSSSTNLDSSMVTSHSQALTGLTGNTLYHFRVKSRDAAQNLRISGDNTFTTTASTWSDTTPPTFSDISGSSGSNTTATITWKTNESSDGQVEYGTTVGYGSSTTLDSNNMVTWHSQVLTGLNPGTEYHYRVKSKDAVGNLAISGDNTFVTSSQMESGLIGQYFANISLSGTPVLTRTDSFIGFNWDTGHPDPSVPATPFSVHWSGQIQAQYSETYTFYADVDEAVRLYVNGQTLINKWNNNGAELVGTIALVAGQKYDIIMEYYNGAGSGSAQLSWSSASTGKEPVPASAFTHRNDTFVDIAVTPAETVLTAGHSQQFTAVITGNSNKSVTWTASEGTIDASGLYTAPSTVTSQQSVTITATSQADTNQEASANVMLALNAPWYSGAWSYRRPLTINGGLVSGHHLDFPLLVSRVQDPELKHTSNGGHVGKSNGTDILFTLQDGTTKLAHELEKYVSTDGTVVAWVKLPSLASGEAPPYYDTIIYMYYGNASASNQTNASGVWTTGYKGVWHMKETLTSSGQTVADSSGRGNNAVSAGTWTSGQQVAGKIGGALSFNDTDDYLNAGNIEGRLDLRSGTVSGWFWLSSTKTTVGAILGKDNSGNNYGDFILRAINGNPDGKAQVIVTNTIVESNSAVDKGVWKHIAVNFGFGGMKMYLNGDFQEQDPPNVYEVGATNTSASWIMGAQYSGYNYFKGYLDELRADRITRSADWIITEYNNQNSPIDFVSGSTPEILIRVSVSPSSISLYPAQTQQFSATVTGTINTAVIWTASEGTIDSNGLYTAPALIFGRHTATITATSQADATKLGTATIALDVDGWASLTVWRPSTGVWYTALNTSPFTYTTMPWGLSTDTPVSADYDGDGKADIAVRRPDNGYWYILPSGSPSTPIYQQWGESNDIPVPADYDGDGKADIAVWRPGTGYLYVLPSSAPPGVYTSTQWGQLNDIPVPADYDGDGKADIAVWRPGTGYWYVLPSSAPPGVYTSTQWGQLNDIPVPADYDGDGKTDIAVWRPTDCIWYVLTSNNPGNYTTQPWGLSTDQPIPADYDGDGQTDIAVWRSENGYWYILPSGSPSTPISQQWGSPTDVPIVAVP